MSRYEQVCDIIRQRREAAKKEREAMGSFDGEREYLEVLQDAIAEMSGVDPAESTEEAKERRQLEGRRLFEGDVEEIGRMIANPTKFGEMYQRRRCILIHQRYTSWPLQSEMDA